jgi:hypothetical protein
MLFPIVKDEEIVLSQLTIKTYSPEVLLADVKPENVDPKRIEVDLYFAFCVHSLLRSSTYLRKTLSASLELPGQNTRR